MRSFGVISGEVALPQQYTMLRADARGGASLLVHQQLGVIALPTNPGNGKILTLTVNGTAITITFTTGTPTNPGDVKIGATAAATAANLLALLNQPETTTATGIALSAANQTLVWYLSWSLSGTTITASSNNTSLYAPLSSFTASTNATGGSYTAQTMQLYVEAGVVYVNGTRVIFAGGSSPTVTAPSANPRIDVLTIDNAGTLAWTAGAENASPVAPAYPADKIPLCELYNVVAETALYDYDNQHTGQGYVYNDVRPIVGLLFNPAAIPDTLLPATDNTYSLGSASFRWTSIYGVTFYGDGSQLTGVTVPKVGQSFTAGENVTAGQPACLLAVPASDVGYDTSATGSGTGTTITSSNVTVANNSNRKLVVIAFTTSGNSGHSISSMAFAGSSMTQDQAGAADGSNGKAYVFHLDAPTVGAGALVITTNNAACAVRYFIYSYYNAAQGTPASSSVVQIGSTTSIQVNSTTNGSLTLSAISTAHASGVTGQPANHQQSPSGFQSGDTGVIYPPGVNVVSWSYTYAGSGGDSAAFIEIAPVLGTSAKVYKAGSALAVLAASFIGFFQSTVLAGVSVQVATAGIDANQSGLTLPDSAAVSGQYYLNDTRGTIGTSPGTVTRKVGIALSTTQIAITNIW